MSRRRRATGGSGPDLFTGGFVQHIALKRDRVPSFESYPFNIPAVKKLDRLDLHAKVTFFIGENGSGKSTLVEGLAVAAGFNAEGGSKNFQFSTRASESQLFDYLQIVRGVRREEGGFFLRAESYYNTATEIENLDMARKHYYGGKSMHEQSHGESFLALARHRFWPKGLYILDEPEAALSPTRQLTLLQIIHRHVTQLGSQFVIATHSPILMAYPDAWIYRMSGDGMERVTYEETDHYRITRDFLMTREAYLRVLMAEALMDSDERASR